MEIFGVDYFQVFWSFWSFPKAQKFQADPHIIEPPIGSFWLKLEVIFPLVR